MSLNPESERVVEKVKALLADAEQEVLEQVRDYCNETLPSAASSLSDDTDHNGLTDSEEDGNTHQRPNEGNDAADNPLPDNSQDTAGPESDPDDANQREVADKEQ